PIRSDLDLEHVIVEPECGDQVRAGAGVRHLDDARVVLLADAELALGAEHALRLDAVDLRGGDPAAARQHGARRRERGADADPGVRRAAHDRVMITARADPAEEQRIAAVALPELALDGFDLADDHALEVGSPRRDPRHLDARVDETLRGLSGRQPPLRDLAPPRVPAPLPCTRTD